MPKREELKQFPVFAESSLELLDGVAEKKGYDGELFKFCQRMGLSHAEGEIIYKVVRYNRKHNPEDLVKIASWAFLIWNDHNEANADPTA